VQASSWPTGSPSRQTLEPEDAVQTEVLCRSFGKDPFHVNAGGVRPTSGGVKIEIYKCQSLLWAR